MEKKILDIDYCGIGISNIGEWSTFNPGEIIKKGYDINSVIDSNKG